MLIFFLNTSEKQNASIDYTPSTPERVFGPRREQQLKLRLVDKDVHITLVGSKLIITRNWLKPILIYGQFKHIPEKISLSFVIHEYVSKIHFTKQYYLESL